MKKITFCVSIILLVIFMTTTISGCSFPKDIPEFTEKGEIVEFNKILEMNYKSDEIKKIIDNTITCLPHNIEYVLKIAIKTMQTYPEYKNIKIEDLEYDLNNYYVSPVLTVEQLNKGESNENQKYYHNIVIPIYLNNKNVYDFIVYYDLYSNSKRNEYTICGHSSYSVYSSRYTPENISILDLSISKEEFEKLVKDEIGEDTEIYNQYLLLGEPDNGNKGIQEDNIYLKTNKGEYVFVSLSGSFSLSNIINIKNNAFYTIEDYFSIVKPEINSNRTKTVERIMQKKFIGIKGGYVFIPSAIVLLTVGIVLIIKVRKMNRKV